MKETSAREYDPLVSEEKQGKVSDLGKVLVILIFAAGYFAAAFIPTTWPVLSAHLVTADPTLMISPRTLSYCESLMYIGWAIGSAFLMPACDRIGRRLPLILMMTSGLCAAFLNALSVSVTSYGLSMFIVGLFLPPGAAQGYLLAVESLPARWCPNVTCGVNLVWTLGVIIIAVVSQQLKDVVDWRFQSLGWYALPALLLPGTVLFVNESPKFRIEQVERRILEDGRNLTDSADLTPFQQILQAPHFRWMIDAILCWIACSTGFYGLTFAAGKLSDNIYTNMMLMGLVDLFGYLIPGPLIARFGWMAVQIGAFATASVSLMCGAFLMPGSVLSPLMISSLIGRVALDVAFVTVYILVVDCFPPECRSTAMGIASSFARLFTVAAPLLSNFSSQVTCPVLGCLCVVGMTATLDLHRTMKEGK